jgi:hypothetical protein
MGNYDPSIEAKRRLFMSKPISSNRAENPILRSSEDRLRSLGYTLLGFVEEGHAICYNGKSGELIRLDQANPKAEAINVSLGLEDLGPFTAKELDAILTEDRAKEGRPDWRKFDEGYHQAWQLVKKDAEGFIKVLRDSPDEIAASKALVAKYGIPEKEAEKLAKMSLTELASID